MRAFLATSLAILAALPASAQQIATCDSWVASARNLSRPLEQATRSFANGAISLIELDTGGEPACCSYHLMVLYPDPEEPFEICALIHREGELGYVSLDVAGARASYDPARGLTVRIPAAEYGDMHNTPLSLDVTINQQTGVVLAEHGTP